MKILSEEIRYPQLGDKFFIDTGTQNETANIKAAFQEFGGYAYGYQTGALTLLDSAISEPDLQDFYIYPVVFLIRHYLELRLKELIHGLNFLKDQSNSFPDHHNLQNLWKDFKTAYYGQGQTLGDDIIKSTDALIKEFDDIDPNSMTFRYPVDKKGNKIQRLEMINLLNLKETFVRVCFFYDGVAMQIADYVETTEAMIQDMYSDFYN